MSTTLNKVKSAFFFPGHILKSYIHLNLLPDDTVCRINWDFNNKYKLPLVE